MTAAEVKRIAHRCGFELAGVAAALPNADFPRYRSWVDRGHAGGMSYLADRRADVRSEPRNLLPSARSIVCVGRLYNGPQPYSTELTDRELATISRYAWGDDYHAVLRRGLEELAAELGPHDYKICVDTAPLLERSYARNAGLGWIGKNTCLINQHAGSWFFLGELITSLALEPDAKVPDRCGSCTRCIEACPTSALIPDGSGWTLDARLCISYFTIELRGGVPQEHRAGIGTNIFGCDICQDVCPWNARAAMTLDRQFAPRPFDRSLERLAAIGPEEFRGLFQQSPVARTKYSGFLRNVAIAMGNSRSRRLLEPLRRLAEHDDPVIAEHARWGIRQLEHVQESETNAIPA